MRLPETVKNWIRPRNQQPPTSLNCQEKGEDEEDVHYTPPGRWPTRGPQPTKFGVLFYYISLICCIMGILTMFKCTYLPHEERPQILLLGGALVVLGFTFLAITNYIYNREHRLLIQYLEGKIEELMEENKGKGPRALDS